MKKGLEEKALELLTNTIDLKIEYEKLKVENKMLREQVEYLKSSSLKNK